MQHFDTDLIENYRRLQSSPVAFCEAVWGLKPQPPYPEYKDRLERILELQGEEWEEGKKEIDASWFGEPEVDEYTGVTRWRWYYFKKGKHMTWQQTLILKGVEKALSKDAKNTISIASGRGIGKTASISWIMLWFLFAFKDCQISATAPGFQQMYDVLWKEIALWIQRMPPRLREKYEWESSHIRIKESPYTWFARAKTASKENAEALSGVHGDYVMAIADEGSGIPDEIFDSALGIFSSPNPFLFMISNPTRREGFFFRSHHQSKANWQTFQFSSEESPVVHHDLLTQYSEAGVDSDKYRVNVLGQFPSEEALDGDKYINLINESRINMQKIEDIRFRGPILGVDPAGEGDNESAFVLRDNVFAKVAGAHVGMSPKKVADTVMTLAEEHKISPKNIVVDSFGIGSETGKELALSVRWSVTTVNVAEPSEGFDRELFINKRAQMYWRLKEWIEAGGVIMQNEKLREQLLTIKFKRTGRGGRIQIMSKHEMLKNGYQSPDLADAFALTFLRKPGQEAVTKKQNQIIQEQPFDRWSI
jgi:phage terminase large subunit